MSLRVKDPLTHKIITLTFEKEGDAEYYRIPKENVPNFTYKFGLSKLDITDIHTTCVKNSFHLTMKIKGSSFHIGVRPNSDNSVIEFWPVSGLPDYLKTYKENIYDALHYIFGSIIKENKSIPITCGQSNLTEIINDFKKINKNKFIPVLMSPSPLPPPRSPLTPLNTRAKRSLNLNLPNSASPKVGDGKSKRDFPKPRTLNYDENDGNLSDFGTTFNLKLCIRDLKLLKKF
jgi:hypothetical protein